MLIKFCILHCLNMCWKNCLIPIEWKTAKVISILKKGNRNYIQNYRGITLLNGYISGNILNQSLQAITDVISGFRKGHSCSYNAFIIRIIIQKDQQLVWKLT